MCNSLDFYLNSAKNIIHLKRSEMDARLNEEIKTSLQLQEECLYHANSMIFFRISLKTT